MMLLSMHASDIYLLFYHVTFSLFFHNGSSLQLCSFFTMYVCIPYYVFSYIKSQKINKNTKKCVLIHKH